jgi:hypothetical protein
MLKCITRPGQIDSEGEHLVLDVEAVVQGRQAF